jgi:hypothetical protein
LLLSLQSDLGVYQYCSFYYQHQRQQRQRQSKYQGAGVVLGEGQSPLVLFYAQLGLNDVQLLVSLLQVLYLVLSPGHLPLLLLLLLLLLLIEDLEYLDYHHHHEHSY